MLSVMATFENLTVHRDGPTTTITLDRPEKRNALSAAMMAELTEAVLAAGASDALAVVIAAKCRTEIGVPRIRLLQFFDVVGIRRRLPLHGKFA